MAVGIDAGFLTRQYAGVPMWGWIIGGVGLLVGVTKLKGSSTPAANPTTSPGATSAATGAAGGDPGNVYFLPQQGYPSPNPSQVNVNLNPRDSSHPERSKMGKDVRQEVPTSVLASGDLTSKGAPWFTITALPGESWKDITARMYDFGPNYASVSDPSSRARIDSVAAFIQTFHHGENTSGPRAGQEIYFH